MGKQTLWSRVSLFLQQKEYMANVYVYRCDAGRFPKVNGREQRHGECKLSVVHYLSTFA